MTLSNLVSTGSGRLAARWQIEGLPLEFVTDPGMEQTLADGRRRLCCTSLADCGFKIEESANLPEARLEGLGTSLTLWENLDEDLSALFSHKPSIERFGGTGITDTETTLTLRSTSGITAGDVLHLGTEAVKVGSVDSGTDLTLSDRGYWSTVAQYHYASDTAGHPDLVATDRPLRVRGRQVRLYLYGDGDDLQGDGSQRWIFCTALSTWLTALKSTYSLDSTYSAEPTLDGKWTIRVVVGSGTYGVYVSADSEQDGILGRHPGSLRHDAIDGEPATSGALSTGDELYVTAEDTQPSPQTQRTVPRGYWGISDRARVSVSAPHDRVYVDRDVDATWTSVTASWPGLNGDRVQSIISRDSGDNWIQLNRFDRRPAGIEDDPQGFLYTAGTLPVFRGVRTVTTGDLNDLRTALTSEAVRYANLGLAPFVTERDLASWSSEVFSAARYRWQRERFYTFADSIDFEEYLSHELRLLGLYLVTDTTGRLALANLALPTGQTTAVFDIDEEILTVDGQPQELSFMARGNQTVNRVRLYIGYDPRDGDWAGWREVQDMTSFALDHQDRLLDVKPYSWAIGGITPEADDVANVFLPVMSLFGYPHEFVTIKVTWKAFDVRLGDAVTFSASHLPSYITGARPINSVKGVVTGRKWDLEAAHGELTVLLSWQNVAGYAPSALVSSQADNGGDQWTLTIDAGLYFGGSDDPTDHFVAGDRVRIVQIDSESATNLLGTVDSATATTITVTFDGTWTPGSDAWVLQFATHSEASASGNAGQLDYAYLAGTDLLLGSSDAEPRTLAP